MKVDKSILVLDDDALYVQTIERMFNESDILVRHTSELTEFIYLLAHLQPTFVIFDLVLSDVDGIDIISLLARQKTCVNVIIMSSVSRRILEVVTRLATERGIKVMGILPKPFRPKHLRMLIESNLELSDLSIKSAPIQTISNPDLLVENLKKALESNALSICLQPKFNCKTLQPNGFEVLSRWYDEEYGHILPDVFISIAENNSLITSLTESTCKKAFAWFSQFKEKNTRIR